MKNVITSFRQIKEILEPIPAGKFVVGRFGPKVSGEDDGCSCALGHINRHFYPEGRGWGDSLGRGSRYITAEFLRDRGIEGTSIVTVNDGGLWLYPQTEIKDRVMAFIEDGIKWEDSKSRKADQ